jgi:hypothetical protein
VRSRAATRAASTLNSRAGRRSEASSSKAWGTESPTPTLVSDIRSRCDAAVNCTVSVTLRVPMMHDSSMARCVDETDTYKHKQTYTHVDVWTGQLNPRNEKVSTT